MAFPDAQQLTELLQPKLAERGLDVEDIKTTKAGKKSQVVIRIDGDKRPSSDVLEEVSNEISAFFDAKEEAGELNFGAGYTLEVSTPGVDLPLTAPRHWRRNRGRKVSFDLGDGKSQTARIGALNDAADAVILITANKKDVQTRAVRLENIARAVVKIEFAQPSEQEIAAVHKTFEEAEN